MVLKQNGPVEKGLVRLHVSTCKQGSLYESCFEMTTRQIQRDSLNLDLKPKHPFDSGGSLSLVC